MKYFSLLLIFTMYLMNTQVLADTGWIDIESMKSDIASSLRIVTNNVSLDGKMTARGYEGYISIRQYVIPQNSEKSDSSEALALKYLNQIAKYLGIDSFDHVKLIGYKDNNFTESFGYGIYLNNIQVEDWRINVSVFKSTRKTKLSGTIFPISPEMLAAANKKTLSKNYLKQRILSSAQSNKSDIYNTENQQKEFTENLSNFSKTRIGKLIVNYPPYVIYKVVGNYNYVVDAVTGTIIKKQDARQY